MTEQEAIKDLIDENEKCYEQCEDCCSGVDTDAQGNKCTCRNAIILSALEEIQQYRALGTVEKLKAMKESALSGLELANIWAALEQLKKYEAIGTLEEMREAREKQVPKKPIFDHMLSDWRFKAKCPTCETLMIGDVREHESTYCLKCGQRIDWRDESGRKN